MARMGGLPDGFHSVPHFSRGRGSTVRGIVIHQFAGGTVPAVQNWLRDSRSRVSYHFGVGRDGRARQWVDTADTAWATGPANGWTIAIGHEAVNTPFTIPAQIDMTARIVRWARSVHGNIPVTRAGITGHRQHMQTTCPGNPIFGQLDDLQRRSVGAPAPPPAPPPPPSGVPPWPGRILINRASPNMMSGQDVRTWQERVRARSDLPTIAADGWYGPQSEAAARQVQRIAGFAASAQDGRVGQNTWPVTWTTGSGAIGTAPPPPPPQILEEVEMVILRYSVNAQRTMTYVWDGGSSVVHIPSMGDHNALAAARLPVVPVTLAMLRNANGGRDPANMP